MPLFARRRIQAMLDELGPMLSPKKANDILARLGRPRQPDQVIAAEMELGLLWATKQVAHIEIEPENSDGRLPDCHSHDLFGDTPAIVEITTVSDAHFSGEKLMHRAFSKIGDFANTIRKGAKKNLSLQFAERSSWENGRYQRERCITADFELDDEMRSQIRAWLLGPQQQALRLKSTDIDVAITWQVGRQVRTASYWSTLPPLAHDIEANPVYGALTRKRKQLRHTPTGTLRCIFLADGGCELLRNLDREDSVGRTHSGNAIIEHAMKQAKLDIVCCFAPKRQTDLMRPQHGGRIDWAVTVIARPELAPRLDLSRLKVLAGNLPRPRFEGYQARSLQNQASFMPNARGWYLGMTTTWRRSEGKDEIMLKISARALQEFLAGRLTRDQFDRWVDNDKPNLFEHFLKQGYTLSGSRLEPAGKDEDDDHIVFEFTKDASASEFQVDKVTDDAKT